MVISVGLKPFPLEALQALVQAHSRSQVSPRTSRILASLAESACALMQGQGQGSGMTQRSARSRLSAREARSSRLADRLAKAWVSLQGSREFLSDFSANDEVRL